MQLEGFTDASHILRAGVYALVSRGRVIYVGKSKRMLSRIDQHRAAYTAKRKRGNSWLIETLGIAAITFDEIHIRPCRLEELDDLEREMITRYQPQYNTKLRTPGRLPEIMTMPSGLSVSLVPPAAPTLSRRSIAFA